MSTRLLSFIAAVAVALPLASANAASSYKIGSSVGLTGYAVGTDIPWKDGVSLAVQALNAQGGILGHKIDLTIMDNHSLPQQAVVDYQKMISDGVQIFDSGCVSAGNFAGAPFVARAKIPMMLCSIMPPLAYEKKFAFSFLPPPPFEIETRYNYLKTHTKIREVGVMHDPTPYGLFLNRAALALAPKFGIKVVVDETYQQTQPDLSNEIDRIHAAGAGAVMLLGQGDTAVTAAKDVEHLGLTHMLLLDSINETQILLTAGKILGPRFLFPAPLVQIYQHDPDMIPAGPEREAAVKFLSLWNKEYGNVDPSQASRAWDSMMMVDKAATMAKSLKGAAIIAAFEKIGHYVGAGASYDFSPQDHVGVHVNPYVIADVQDGKMHVLK